MEYGYSIVEDRRPALVCWRGVVGYGHWGEARRDGCDALAPEDGEGVCGVAQPAYGVDVLGALGEDLGAW